MGYKLQTWGTNMGFKHGVQTQVNSRWGINTGIQCMADREWSWADSSLNLVRELTVYPDSREWQQL